MYYNADFYLFLCKTLSNDTPHNIVIYLTLKFYSSDFAPFKKTSIFFFLIAISNDVWPLLHEAVPNMSIAITIDSY